MTLLLLRLGHNRRTYWLQPFRTYKRYQSVKGGVRGSKKHAAAAIFGRADAETLDGVVFFVEKKTNTRKNKHTRVRLFFEGYRRFS